MSDIGINSSNTETAVSELITEIQTGIIDAAQTYKNNIVNAVADSKGDFIDSFISEVEKEAETINEVGELLIEMANFIQSVSDALVSMDETYHISKGEKI